MRKMKTISGHYASVQDVSLSIASKILSKFVSVDNGASHIISAYLRWASASFRELTQIHKELESSHSHKKHKRHRTETGTDSGGKKLTLLPRFLQSRWYLQYFLSRLYQPQFRNHACKPCITAIKCVFSTSVVIN